MCFHSWERTKVCRCHYSYKCKGLYPKSSNSFIVCGSRAICHDVAGNIWHSCNLPGEQDWDDNILLVLLLNEVLHKDSLKYPSVRFRGFLTPGMCFKLLLFLCLCSFAGVAATDSCSPVLPFSKADIWAVCIVPASLPFMCYRRFPSFKL